VKVRKIGVIGIDTGRCLIGDPCYIEDMPSKPRKAKSKREWRQAWPCIEVSTGWGDGIYPVYAEIDEDGSVASVTVQFLPHPYFDFDDDDQED
jgi:hypothetical protein